MAIVTAKQLVAFKKHLLAGNRTAHTVKIMLSPIKTIYKFAVREDYFSDDPSLKLTVQNAVAGTRPDFTPSEQAQRLEASRHADPLIRWGIWLMGMTGASNKEAFCTEKEHFELRDRLVIWNLHGFKTKFRTREIPLHSAIIAEGFVQYLESLVPGSRIFPMVGSADADKISVNAGQRINPWIKATPRRQRQDAL